MGCGAGSVFANLRPHEFRRIELGRAGWKRIQMEARMLRQKRLELAPSMDRMLIPDQDDRATDRVQQVTEKDDHLFAADGFCVGLNVQLDLALSRCHAQGTDQVQAFVVFETGTNGRRLPTRGPGPFERRHRRIPTFIRENQGGRVPATFFICGQT